MIGILFAGIVIIGIFWFCVGDEPQIPPGPTDNFGEPVDPPTIKVRPAIFRARDGEGWDQ